MDKPDIVGVAAKACLDPCDACPGKLDPRLLFPIPLPRQAARHLRRILREVRLGRMLHAPHRHRHRRVTQKLLNPRDRNPRLGRVLISSTALTLIVLPVVYEWLEERWPDWARQSTIK